MAMKMRLGKAVEKETRGGGGDLRDTMEMSASPGRKKAPVSRTLLLLLLLVVVAAAGYFYLIGLPEEEPVLPPPAPAKPVRKAIVMPAPPAPAKGEEAAAPPTAAAPDRQGPPGPGAAKLPAQPGAAGSPAQAPKQAAPAAAVPPSATPAKAGVPAPEAKAVATPPPAAPAPKAADIPASPPVAVSGKYVLDAGTYLIPLNRLQAENAVRSLGFTPRITPVKRELEMVRLRVGVFPAAEARERLRDLVREAPDAFTLPQGDQVALYAGSYYDLDQARGFADRIFQRGIRVDEETAKVLMTMQRVTFGSFADASAAKTAAAKARAAGLPVTVVRKK